MDIELPEDFSADLNDQTKCPLIRLPLEVRRTIYEFAFTEQNVPNGNYVQGIDDEHLMIDSESPAPDHHRSLPNWVRPGCTARTKIYTALLRTCQFIYSEASSILLSNTTHKCYQGYGPGVSPSLYFEKLTAPQLSNVCRLHLFTQVGDFDFDGLWLRNQLRPVAKSLQHLTITLRDLGGAPSTHMLLNPFRRGVAERQSVDEFMEKTESGKKPKVPKTGWGGTFASLPALKTVTMELEDTEKRESELEALVLWAKKWEFPLGANQFMTSNKIPSSRAWRRPVRHHHHHHTRHESYKPPRIITWTIQWDSPRERIVVNDIVHQHGPSTEAANGSRIPRPAYDPCLGGLNSIFSGATDAQIRSLIEYGIL